MKILLYGINFAPELTGIGKYTGEMAAWLAAQGHAVRVVTAPPYYPAWAVSAGHSGKRWVFEEWRGVRVWRCPLWVPPQPGGLKRLLHLASFALSSLPVMLRQVFWRADVVWGGRARAVLRAHRVAGGAPGWQQGLPACARL